MQNSHIFNGFVVLLAVTLLVAPTSVALAQGGSGGGSSSGSTGGSSGSSAGTSRDRPVTPGSTSAAGEQPSFGTMRRPMYLQGNVVFEDGTPAPPNIVMERVCGGHRIPEDYTDSKGQFSFEVGRQRNLIPDASTGSAGMGRDSNSVNPYGARSFGTLGAGEPAISEDELRGCRLEARLAGYRSSFVELSGRRMLDNPEVGTIVLTKMGGVSGYTISATSLRAPKDAVKCYENGVKASRKTKWGKARSELEKAVNIHPEYAEAWFALGEVFEAQKKPELASEAYNKAIEADSQYVFPYMKLAMMDARNSKWTEAAERTGQVLKMNPYDFGDAYYLHSMANLNLNRLAEAESSARKSIELDVGRKHPQAEQILGLALALQNKYGEASEHLHTYLELLPDAPNAETVRGQIAQLEGLMAQQGGAKAP